MVAAPGGRHNAEPTAQVDNRKGGIKGNFAAHIAQDDNNVAVKSREMLKQQERNKFRPGFRETYKDQKGQKQTTVHEGMNGNVWLATNESQGQDDVPKTEKSTENGVYVGE
ncbi:hypothetical protein G6514_005275 [Epicoccum nigrum]|nr:hypothetical protein G6514_005275 [Epicoccum nigrum]